MTGKDANWNPNGEVIAEGTVCAPTFPAGIPINIPMGVHQCGDVLGPTMVDVKAVGDVILVVHANTYSMGDGPGNIVPDPNP